MNRPSLVSRSKFSVSDLTVTPRPRSSPMVVSTCAAERPHRSDFQNTRVAGPQGGQGPGELRPRRAVLAGLLLGKQLVIAVRVQGIELQLRVLVPG